MAEKWLPPLEYKSQPITVAVNMTSSHDLAFHLSKALLLPLDMVECNADSESLIKGSIQMVTALAQQLHVLEQRRLEQVTDFNRTTQLLSDADLALKSAEVERVRAEEEVATARASALAKEKALLETEKTAMVALVASKEVKQRKVEVEAELEAMKADQANLIEEAIQKGWDEAEADYAQQVLELRDGLFATGWTKALRAVGTEETSALFMDIPVPSKTAIARATKAKGTLVAKNSEATLSISPLRLPSVTSE